MKNESLRRHIANSAIGTVVLVAILIFAATIIQSPKLFDFVIVYSEINHIVQCCIAALLLVVAMLLYQRKRVAWTLCIILLPASLILHFVLHNHPIGIVIIILEAYALLALLICHSDFRRPMHKRFQVKKLSPDEKTRIRNLVLKYGQNPCSYLALEDDKIIYSGKDVDGVIAYGIVGNVVTVCADPICAPEDFIRFLAEFKAFCSECSYECIFLGTTNVFLKEYEMLGYSHVKSGEEAVFKLAEYQLAGGKMAKLRTLINHANKEVTTHEYKPGVKKDTEIEKGIDEVSKAWLEGKKSSQLGFSVGGVGLEDPLDRRYFYATDADGKIVAFNVFLPYACNSGYMADVTRRVPHAPGGVTEKLIYDGFMVFKDEGAKWGSMGQAPLANVHEDGIKDNMTVKIIEFIYENCNKFYGFKDLHKAKEKYSPTIWAPGYFVFSTKNITPEMVFASIKIQNPGGISDYLLSSIRGLLK
ncbi:MAG: DUF2156 domain-containing protein [Oscillospiraceae bacterium]|nr:DUF2156 domain-containing protein [Oscillospiraceae bacterium]